MSKSDVLTIDMIGEMYASNHQWLVNWLSRRIGCPYFAADMAQDTFARVLSARQSFYIEEAKALLTTIAKGLVVDYYRRSALEHAYLKALALLPEPEIPSAESRAILLETMIEVDRMLDSLSSKARRIFLLSQIDGLTYPEIAIKEKVTVSSVQKYMTKAYTVCYQVLQEK